MRGFLRTLGNNKDAPPIFRPFSFLVPNNLTVFPFKVSSTTIRKKNHTNANKNRRGLFRYKPDFYLQQLYQSVERQ